MRSAAVFNNDSTRAELAEKLASKLKETGAFQQVTVFTRDKTLAERLGSGGAKVIPDSCDTISKARNFINASCKATGCTGFLHVLEDIVELVKDPHEFLDALEKAMQILDYDVWLDASCDPCNYVYSKFNPRLSVELDKPELKRLGLSSPRLLFTSHSNTAWMCYNLDKTTADLMNFNESFDIPMFMIIEFLARRRNTKRPDQVYLMNMYMTVPEEIGVFKVSTPSAGGDPTPEKMAEEDKIFKSLGVNFAPDNNIDALMEVLWNKLNSKLAS